MVDDSPVSHIVALGEASASLALLSTLVMTIAMDKLLDDPGIGSIEHLMLAFAASSWRQREWRALQDL